MRSERRLRVGTDGKIELVLSAMAERLRAKCETTKMKDSRVRDSTPEEVASKY